MNTLVPINVPAWWLIITPVLVIILIGIIVLIVLNNIPKNTGDDKKDEKNLQRKDKTLTSWIKKKDLLYWLLIICLGAISLFTFRYKDASEVISHWGFAGTIVSIILAVVAIGFTLFQTLSSNLSSEKIAVSADKIELATINLDPATLKQSSKIMIDAADYLKEKITFIEEKLNLINEDQKAISELAASGFGPKTSNENEDDKIASEMIALESFFIEVVTKIPYYPQFYVYALIYLVSNGVD